MAETQDLEMLDALNDERAMRRIKRQQLIDAGVNPYPIHVDVTAHNKELIEKYSYLEDGQEDDTEVTVAGRIRAIRGHGKLMFLELEDSTATLQLFPLARGVATVTASLTEPGK